MAFYPNLTWADKLENYFHNQWYTAEVIIFQYPENTESEELLLLNNPIFLPSNIGTFQINYSLPLLENTVGQQAISDKHRTVCGIDSSSIMVKTLKEGPATLVNSVFGSTEPPNIQPYVELIGAEFLPPKINPYLEKNRTINFLDKIGEFEERLMNEHYPPSWKSNKELESYSRRLANSKIGQILLHKRWTQIVPNRQSPQPIFIQAGTLIDDLFSLEGTISVSMNRYLHFEANLLHRMKKNGSAPSGDLIRTDLPNSKFMGMSESRRMRSGEIHYLDHPKFGVLVRIDPVAVPDTVTSAFGYFKEKPQ